MYCTAQCTHLLCMDRVVQFYSVHMNEPKKPNQRKLILGWIIPERRWYSLNTHIFFPPNLEVLGDQTKFRNQGFKLRVYLILERGHFNNFLLFCRMLPFVKNYVEYCKILKPSLFTSTDITEATSCGTMDCPLFVNTTLVNIFVETNL